MLVVDMFATLVSGLSENVFPVLDVSIYVQARRTVSNVELMSVIVLYWVLRRDGGCRTISQWYSNHGNHFQVSYSA